MSSDWQREEIPDTDAVYRAIDETFVNGDSFSPSGFKTHGDDDAGVSVFWEEYASPQEVKDYFPNPSQKGVVELIKQAVEDNVPQSRVVHDPVGPERAKELGVDPNPAHSLIERLDGPVDEEFKIKLKRVASWVTDPP